VREELPAEQRTGRSRGSGRMALPSAIDEVDRHDVSVGRATGTTAKQGQQALYGSRNGTHFLARFSTDWRV
jgi:hypothetical protein